MSLDETRGVATADPWPAEPEGALGETIVRLLSQGGGFELSRALEELGLEHGPQFFSELLHVVAHLNFEPDEAIRHWQSIRILHESMAERLGEPVDIRVALVSYFVDVSHQLKNPKVIELQLFQETQDSVFRDALTGLYNFRYFREHLSREVRRSQRYATPLSLVMMDIDDFKSYNDTNGHHAGNRVLEILGALLRSDLPEGDVPVRYGGEEFAITLPSMSKEDACVLAEALCRKIEGQSFANEHRQPRGKLTVSVGIATYPADAGSADELVAAADQAMYKAKSCGKNQAFLYGESHRSHPRVDASLDGRWRSVTGDNGPLTTLNVSEGGLLFTAESPIETGTLVEISLPLGRVVAVAVKVLRSDSEPGGGYRIAARTVDIMDDDRRLLGAWVRRQERSHGKD